jgi:hypothetical protein
MRAKLGFVAAALWLFGSSLVEPSEFGPTVARSQMPSSYYCGERLISLGTSIEEVPRVCGEPDTKLQRFGRHCFSDPWQERCVATLIDEWVYDYGPERLKRRMTFVNARLVEVRTDGFGRAR